MPLALLSLATTAALQAQDFTYTTNFPDTNTITITDYKGPTNAVMNIPRTINGLTVTCIGLARFGGVGTTNVTIPDSVTSIGEGAFTFGSHFTSIIIPDSVTTIGKNAFACSDWPENVKISRRITNIPYGMFDANWGLRSVIIPDNVTNIGDFAFRNCHSLTNVVIGAKVASIGKAAFADCESLTSIYFKGNAPRFGSHAFVQGRHWSNHLLFARHQRLVVGKVLGKTCWSSACQVVEC